MLKYDLSLSPYGDIIKYSDHMYSAEDIIMQYGFDPRINDLSRCRNWNDFIKKLNYCCVKQFSVLDKGGRMFILVGDIKKRGRLYSMVRSLACPGTLEQIIIKAQHNCWSDNQEYNGNFVKINHEYLLVLKKEFPMIYEIHYEKCASQDLRDSVEATWRDVIAAILQHYDREMQLSEIYSAVEGHKKCKNNSHWKEKIRQTLQQHEIFCSLKRGTWTMAA